MIISSSLFYCNFLSSLFYLPSQLFNFLFSTFSFRNQNSTILSAHLVNDPSSEFYHSICPSCQCNPLFPFYNWHTNTCCCLPCFRLGTHTKLYTMNPKACSVIELYGTLDPLTRDWTDGLLSNIFRDINRPTEKQERKYILFDGDVDALWVENMNSVMDDNKLLTLANGERIRLQSHCALLFEVSSYVIYILLFVLTLWVTFT